MGMEKRGEIALCVVLYNNIDRDPINLKYTYMGGGSLDAYVNALGMN